MIDPSTDGAPVSNTPPVPSAPTTPPPAAITTPGPQQQPNPPAPTDPSVTAAPMQVQPPTAQQQQNPQQPSAVQPGQPSPSDGTVSNTPSVHPSVARAGLLRQVASALAGGPQTRTSVDPATGVVSRVQVPLTKADIGMALAFEALSGALTGLGQRGPNAVGLAGAAGVQQGMQLAGQRQQAQQQQSEQAKADADNQYQTLAKRASIYEANSRTILNTSEAEQQGAEAIDKLTSINRESGVLDISPELMDNGGQPMTNAELLDAMKSGKLSPTDQVGPVAGRVEVTRPDGSKYWEATHLIIRDPNTPVTLTQADYDRYSAGSVKGFPAGTRIGQGGYQVPLRVVQNSNEQLASHYLAGERLYDLRNVLDGTQYAKQVPEKIDFSKPGVDTALQHFQKYVSHNSDNLNDPFAALQAMGTDKRDPKTGAMMPNPDAKYVDQAAQAMGGWSVLEAAHNQIAANKKAAADFAVIDTDAKATAVLAAPKRFSPDQVSAAQRFRALNASEGAAKASQEARARAQAEGTDVKAMYQYGRNPVTGEVLNLNNAPPSMLVDSTGQVVPQDMVSAYKPSAMQKQTADTARQVLSISAGLQAELQKNPNLAGPLAGRSKAGLAKLGYGDAQSQKFLDDISFLQTASTKMHTGRFSNAILDKMGNLIQPGMNSDQFTGALSSINGVASRYADEDRLTTVNDYKRQMATPQNPAPVAGRQVQIPAGAQIGRDGKGNVVGYKLNGQYVSLGGQN